MRVFISAMILASSAFASEMASLERMQTASLNQTQRNDACFELRGSKSPAVVAAMRKALGEQSLRACAAKNLRAAGAIDLMRDALKDEAPDVRSAAVLELGGFAKTEDLAALGAAAHDENMLVSTNAVYALAMYTDARVVPYLAEIARVGGLVGTQALGRLAQRGAPEAADVARVLVKSKDAPDRLAAIKVLGELGSKSDLPVLREIQEKEGGELSSKGRGFGLMPTVSLSRAARTAIELIEQRGS